jgi:hypothetical protein
MGESYGARVTGKVAKVNFKEKKKELIMDCMTWPNFSEEKN